MGTSLKVAPFSYLLQLIPLTTPIILLNRENPGIVHPSFLFLEGDIEESVLGLCEGLGWHVGGSILSDAEVASLMRASGGP